MRIRRSLISSLFPYTTLFRSRNHGADFFVAQHLVIARLLDVKDLAFERQNGLKTAVAALLGCSTCGLTFDQEELATVGIALGTVCQLAGQAATIERALAAGKIAGLPGSFTRARGLNGFIDDLAGDRGGLLKETAQALIQKCLHYSGTI